MKRFIGSILAIIMITLLAGCGAENVKEAGKENEDIKFSENVITTDCLQLLPLMKSVP